jgi:hypothetical protein
MSSTMSPCGFDTEWGLTKPHPLDRCAEFLVHSAAPLIRFSSLSCLIRHSSAEIHVSAVCKLCLCRFPPPTVQEVEGGTITTYPHLDNAQRFFPNFEDAVFITTDQVPADQTFGWEGWLIGW